MINWTKLTVDDIKSMAEWSIRIGFFNLAKELIKDLEEHKKLAKNEKYVKMGL